MPPGYHALQLERAEADVIRIESWDIEEVGKKLRRIYDRECLEYLEALAGIIMKRSHCYAMLIRIKAWTPLTPEHVASKDSSVKHLEGLINRDYNRASLEVPRFRVASVYQGEQLKEARGRVAYHTRCNQDEIRFNELTVKV